MNGPPLRLPHPDWLHHHLEITGPAADLAAFRAAAAGPGTIPWQLDTDRMEEDWFHRLLGAGALSLPGAEILARQLRDAVVARHQAAQSRAPHSRACPLDLHALIPIPASLLTQGPDHPDALDWLWTNWGTTEPLRRVTQDPFLEPSPPGRGQGEGQAETHPPKIRLTFWSADWTPWRALARLRGDWPTLTLDLHPNYKR